MAPQPESTWALPTRNREELWLSILRKPWSSLAVIPVGSGVTARSATNGIEALVTFFDSRPFRLLDAEKATLGDGGRIVRELQELVAAGSRVVVMVDSPLRNPGALPSIMEVEAAILLVRLGVSNLREAASVVEIVGRERVLGCVVTGS